MSQSAETPTEGSAASAMPWQPVQRARASNAIVDQVRQALFEGGEPGQWLGSERELAETFQVSRTTVRDAVRTLEANGIVDVQVGAKGGIRFAAGDPDRFADALAIQLALVGIDRDDVLDAQVVIERATVERAARLADDDDLARMRRLLEEAGATLDQPERNTALSLDFHLAIAQASKSTVFAAFLKALRAVLHRHYLPGTSPAVSAAVLAAHWELYELIRDGNAEGAVQRMSDHIADTQAGRHVPPNA
ncbi:FadR family transcriptional regulator [Nitriliruptoraceae bacterium ZYF776]|nr:FadR family transcriptional regulator [Profundirhabdus halotolerans]